MVGKKIFPAVKIISCLYAIPPGGRSQSCSRGGSASLGKGRTKRREEGRKEERTFTVAKNQLENMKWTVVTREGSPQCE